MGTTVIMTVSVNPWEPNLSLLPRIALPEGGLWEGLGGKCPWTWASSLVVTSLVGHRMDS